MMEGTFHSELLDDGSNGQTASGSDDDNLNRFLEDTLGSVLRSARESAADLMERAKRSSEQQVEDTRRLWEDAQREVDRMSAWRALVEPLVATANEKVQLIQQAVAEVPGRVADALSPVNEALTEMDQIMDALTHALQPPAGGPSGSGNPNGGSRPIGAHGDAIPELEPVGAVDEPDDAYADEPVAQVTESDDDAAQEPAEQATENTDDGASFQDEPVPADITVAQEAAAEDDAAFSHDGSAEVTGMANGEAEPAHPAEELEGSEQDQGSSETSPTWVTWPATDAVGADTPDEGADLAPNAAGSAQPDEDDAALRSTTSQLRRAVTDIDWNDLPSASSA
jgi:hypothetical protein